MSGYSTHYGVELAEGLLVEEAHALYFRGGRNRKTNPIARKTIPRPPKARSMR